MAKNNAKEEKAGFLTSHVWGLTRCPWEDRGGSQLFGEGSCSSLSEAWKDQGVTRDSAKRNTLL